MVLQLYLPLHPKTTIMATKLIPVSKEVKTYLTQKIKKPETPQQMLKRALKELRESQNKTK